MPVKPKFSIVVPTYNRSHCIQKCINSIYDQKISDFEVVVVDDGSTDDTEAVVKNAGYLNLRYIKKSNGGASSARNLGMDCAEGEYIIFLDSDDYFVDGYLQDATKLVDVDTCVYSQLICKRGHDISYLRPARGIEKDERMDEYLICSKGFITPNGLIVPNTNETPRFCTTLSNGDDMDFAIQLASCGFKFKMARIPSSVWEDEYREDRLSNRQNYVEMINWANENRGILSNRAYLGVIGWHAARSMANSGHRLKAFGLYFRALFARSYSVKLSIIVFMQIAIPKKQYRNFSDWLAKFGITP